MVSNLLDDLHGAVKALLQNNEQADYLRTQLAGRPFLAASLESSRRIAEM